MIWAILVLAVMNITTLVTIFYHNSKQAKQELPARPGQAWSESASIKYSGRYFRDQLNLSGDQMARFVEFNPMFRQSVRDLNIELREKKQEMLLEMTEIDSDTAKLNSLSDSIGILHADLKKLTYRYYMDFKKLCDKQQQEKLEQLFGEMFAADDQMGQYGNRGPHGRGRGRQLYNY
jgi:hypothetical protein